MEMFQIHLRYLKSNSHLEL